METIEVIINATDRLGRTGGNFIFEWRTKKNSFQPTFEGVMVSLMGNQGFSFVTRGYTLKKD